jgi:hypothetical protein
MHPILHPKAAAKSITPVMPERYSLRKRENS